jgi:hypothetical protein
VSCAAITENASGRSTLRASLRLSAQTLATRPWAFFGHRAFMWTYVLYGSTYLAANVVDSLCEWINVPARMPKLLAVTPVNMTMVIAKDVAFARMFG